MKKLLFFSIILSSFLSNAQFTLLNEVTGNDIVDGSVVTVSQDQLLTHVILTNTGTTSIKATLEVVNINNTDGSEMMQLCFGFHGQGICNTGITSGSIYNSNLNADSHGNYNYLLAGESTNSSDIDFLHREGGDSGTTSFTTYPKDYIFKITAFDSATNTQVGSAITFTYRYSPSGAVNDGILDNNFSVFANAQKQLVVNTENNVSFTMFNLTGQQVINTELSRGTHRLSIAKLPAGIYMVYAKTSNKQIYRKVVIQ
jgi:hypothetical protein